MGPSLPPVGVWAGQFWGRSAHEVRTAVTVLEQAGYRAVWLSEALAREVLTFAAIVLAATETMTVATGVANLWARDPVAMRNGARTLGEAYPGRFVLTVGISHRPLVDRRGHHYGDPLAVTRRYLEAMQAVDYRGPAPESEPPLLVGALGDRMLRVASELADGAHPYLVTPDHTVRARQLLGTDRILAPEQAIALTDDPEVGRAAARGHLGGYLRLDNYLRSLRRQGFTDDDLAGGGSDRLLDSLVAWGGPDAVLARVEAHHAAGANHVALQPLEGPGLDDPIGQLLALAPALAARGLLAAADQNR